MIMLSDSNKNCKESDFLYVFKIKIGLVSSFPCKLNNSKSSISLLGSRFRLVYIPAFKLLLYPSKMALPRHLPVPPVALPRDLPVIQGFPDLPSELPVLPPLSCHFGVSAPNKQHERALERIAAWRCQVIFIIKPTRN